MNFLGPLLRGIRFAAQERSCNLLLACGLGPHSSPLTKAWPAWPVPASDTDFVPVGPWNTDGLIALNPLLSAERSAYIHHLIEAEHPVVFLGDAEGAPAVAIENEGGIRQALTHLIAHGHRQIAFIAGNPEDLTGDGGGRLQAYRSAVQEYGLAADERLIAYGYHVIKGGQQAMRQLIGSDVPFTAAIASNDESAIGAIAVLRENGRLVPHDVAVIGMDDQPRALAHVPSLTTLHVPAFEMGYQATQLLLDAIEGQQPDQEIVRLPTRLIVRQSCGCRPRQDESRFAAGSGNLAQAAAPSDARLSLAAAVSEAVLPGLQQLRFEDVALLSRQLVVAFREGLESGEWDVFRQALDETAQRTSAVGDDAHAWQAALSQLRAALPAPRQDQQPAPLVQTALGVLDWARIVLSEHVHRQYRQHIVEQVHTAERVGLLTARLQTALDAEQIYEALDNYLPEVGITCLGLAFFEPAGDDPVAWTTIRLVSHARPTSPRLRSKDFPPAELVAGQAPFQMALFPLVYGSETPGAMIFEAANLELCATIVRQVAAAFRNIQLYREALKGQRLAEEANRLKSHFLSIVSHELRTPLSLILELSGLILDPKNASTESWPRHAFERIHASARHLDGLIRDVLELARADGGQLKLSYEPVDLTEVLKIVAVVGQQLAHDKGLGWSAEVPSRLPQIRGDAARLRQVLVNLVGNAAKFTAQGSIALEVRADEQTIVIAVRDTGLGIPLAEQAAIFDDFRQSSRTTARGYSGLGLGLALCKRLVELHGGSIGVVSSGGEGAGSAFSVSLPVPHGAGQELAHAEPTPEPDNAALLDAEQSAEAESQRKPSMRQALSIQAIAPEAIAGWPPRRAEAPPQTLIHGREHLTKPMGSLELIKALEGQGPAGRDEQRTQIVLIAEDDPGLLDVHTQVVELHVANCRVVQARNGSQALELIRRELPHLILLDLMMPELDGFGVLEALRSEETLRDIPVIVLTAQTLAEEDMARLNQGVAAVLSKGVFSTGEAVRHIDAALARRRRLNRAAQQLVRKAMAYIHTYYAEPLTPADIARHISMNEDYLTRCFRRELGLTPMAYVNRYRVSKAKQLLTSSGKSISEIALEVGFSTSSYFSQVFRREVGIAPRAYRQQRS